MLTAVLAVVSLSILIAEFWLGIAVTGWSGDDLYVERSESPGPYWAWMVLHTTVCAGLPVLTWLAGI